MLYCQDDERVQYFRGKVNSQMSLILNKFLTRKYEDIEALNFEELCTWSLWPSYFLLFHGKLAAYILLLAPLSVYVMVLYPAFQYSRYCINEYRGINEYRK